MTIKVMIIDDSATVRLVLQEILNQQKDIEVIGTAVDPLFAREKMLHAWPDVIVLDIDMPRMDGITFLKQIMSDQPTPVVIYSSYAIEKPDLGVKALAAGALAIINKPALGFQDYIQDNNTDLLTAIRTASMARLSKVNSSKQAPANYGSRIDTVTPTENNHQFNQQRTGSPKLDADVMLPAPSHTASIPTTDKVIAIGTSTGGTQALESILPRLTPTCAGIVIVQHMPEKFTASFAQRLNSLCQIEVREAKHHDLITTGLALIAPGGKHLLLRRKGQQYFVEVLDGPFVCRHRPSVDVLFRSVASAAGKNAVGYILTGMGDDGARGMKEMADSGAMTFAQDEDSCVVFGMPKEAIEHGGVQHIISLEAIAGSILRNSAIN
jgi:two-component system chemotaxis response regulator CheB